MAAIGYTVRAAAKKLGITEHAIEKAVRDGELRAVALPGRCAFITCAELEIWIAGMPDWLDYTRESTDQSGSMNRDDEDSLASLTTASNFMPAA